MSGATSSHTPFNESAYRNAQQQHHNGLLTRILTSNPVQKPHFDSHAGQTASAQPVSPFSQNSEKSESSLSTMTSDSPRRSNSLSSGSSVHLTSPSTATHSIAETMAQIKQPLEYNDHQYKAYGLKPAYGEFSDSYLYPSAYSTFNGYDGAPDAHSFVGYQNNVNDWASNMFGRAATNSVDSGLGLPFDSIPSYDSTFLTSTSNYCPRYEPPSSLALPSSGFSMASAPAINPSLLQEDTTVADAPSPLRTLSSGPGQGASPDSAALDSGAASPVPSGIAMKTGREKTVRRRRSDDQALLPAAPPHRRTKSRRLTWDVGAGINADPSLEMTGDLTLDMVNALTGPACPAVESIRRRHEAEALIRARETERIREMADFEADAGGGKGNRKDRRRLQNRLAQRAFRARSKVHSQEFEDHMIVLEQTTVEQVSRIEKLTNLVERLQKENTLLKSGKWAAMQDRLHGGGALQPCQAPIMKVET